MLVWTKNNAWRGWLNADISILDYQDFPTHETMNRKLSALLSIIFTHIHDLSFIVFKRFQTINNEFAKVDYKNTRSFITGSVTLIVYVLLHYKIHVFSFILTKGTRIVRPCWCRSIYNTYRVLLHPCKNSIVIEQDSLSLVRHACPHSNSLRTCLRLL